MRAGSVRGCQGEGLPNPPSSLPLSKSGIDLSVGLIKLVSVPSAAVRVSRRPRRCRCSRGVGPAELARGRFPPFTGRCHTCPEFQACTLQRRRLERERVEVGEGAPQAPGGSEGSPERTRRAHPAPHRGPRFGQVAFKSSRKFA